MQRLLLALILLGTSSTAFAQLGEFWLSFGAAKPRNNELGSFSDQAGGTLGTEVDSNFRFILRFAINNESHFGHEFGYAYTRAKVNFSDGSEFFGMPIHQGMYNFLLYATREGSYVRPFATGGVHFSTFYPPGTGAFSGGGVTKFGFNYGAGVKVRVSSMFSARLDVRDYWQGKPDFFINPPSGMLKLLEVSAGLGIVF